MLFCKPTGRTDIVFDVHLPSGHFEIRSLQLQRDAPLLHHWVQLPYARAFWQFDVPLDTWLSAYAFALKSPDHHAFVVALDQQLIAQFDLYRAAVEPLGRVLPVHTDDCGWHLLMAPPPHPQRGMSRLVVQQVVHWFYRFAQARALYAEPDIHNHKACRLLRATGFQFGGNVMFPDKAASLFLLTRSAYDAAYPKS